VAAPIVKNIIYFLKKILKNKIFLDCAEQTGWFAAKPLASRRTGWFATVGEKE
jgi:hypothetical protein